MIVVIDLAGIAFAFWYYIPQFQLEPVVAWLVVPNSSLCVKQPSREFFNELFVLVVVEHFRDLNLVRTVTLQ